jgi:hypothetical protein
MGLRFAKPEKLAEHPLQQMKVAGRRFVLPDAARSKAGRDYGEHSLSSAM